MSSYQARTITNRDARNYESDDPAVRPTEHSAEYSAEHSAEHSVVDFAEHPDELSTEYMLNYPKIDVP